MSILKAHVKAFYCFLISFYVFSVSSSWGITSASIVMCAETGVVYHEHNADIVIPPASLTKMMTLYLTFKALQEGRITFNQKLPVSKYATLAAPSKLWLKAGSTITVREAILAMVTKSANDASIVIAEALGKGSEAHFATLMTQQAHRLGMTKTFFRNAHGLPNKQQNATTARDMAVLSRCLYTHFREYFKFFKEPKFAYNGQVHRNHNHLLGKVPGVDGIKTGFINASGFNLAVSMVRNNRRIIAVVLGGESRQARDNKMVKLLEATYANFERKRRPCQNNHCSIEDLIFSLAAEERQVTSIKTKGKIQHAVYREHCRPAKISEAKYNSMTHMIDDLTKENVGSSPSKKKSLFRSAKKITKKSGQSIHEKSLSSRIRKLEKQRTLKNKKI